MNRDELHALVEAYEANGEPWHTRKLLKKIIDTAVITEAPQNPRPPRTGQQNAALHVDCRIIAEKLNAAGKDMRVVLKADHFVPWTTESVKEHILRPIMKAMTGKKSTIQLQKGHGEIEHIHEVINRELCQRHGIEWHDFPSNDARQIENLGGYKTAAGAMEVPEMDDTNCADKF